MADPAPKTRNWRALENAHKPKGLHLLVFGQVEVSATNKEPVLTETPERNPKNLGLNLTIRTSSGAGAQVMVQKRAHFHKVAKANQYENVIVRWNVGPDRKLPNSRRSGACGQGGRRNEGAQRAARRQGMAKPSGKKPAAKKAAAKKAAAKKAAPKKKIRCEKEPAKAKKAPKKVAKKNAKKRQPRRPRSKR